MKKQIHLQEKRAYTSPRAELISFGGAGNLLEIFSGDTEIWEDDELIILEE